MKECAFCTNSGKMSAEHIFARWVQDLFPAKRIAFYIGGSADRSRRFEAETIDWKAKVVCANCNNTWMSDIESVHGKPVLTPFIVGEIGSRSHRKRRARLRSMHSRHLSWRITPIVALSSSSQRAFAMRLGPTTISRRMSTSGFVVSKTIGRCPNKDRLLLRSTLRRLSLENVCIHLWNRAFCHPGRRRQANWASQISPACGV
jgi:hypothetical protein